MKRLLLVLVPVLTMWAQGASATIIVSLDSIAGQSSPFLWVYRASLQPAQNMHVGDFYTIYDFPGITSASVLLGVSQDPATLGRTFTASVQNEGVNSPAFDIDDDKNIPNVTVTLTGGPDIIRSPGPNKPITLGNVLITSTTNVSTLSDYVAQAALLDNSQAQNQGKVPVAAAIPEPRSVIMMMLGLVAIGVLSFRRRQIGLWAS
jgi:hypothetical protein